MKSVSLFLSMTLLASWITLASCAGLTVKKALRTVDDIANAACMLFGTKHPAEFEFHARETLGFGEPLDEAVKAQFSPKVLCDLKKIVQPFIDDQLALQQTRAAGLRTGMKNGTISK